MNNSTLSTCLFFLIATMNLASQDIHFSQYNLTGSILNPALTGAFDGEIRAMISERENFSDQLRGDAHRARSISLDSKKQFQNGGYVGFGLSRYKDYAGELDFGETEIAASVSLAGCFKRDSVKRHYVSIGAQVGKETRSVDLSSARWASQHDGNGGWDQDVIVLPPTGFSSEITVADFNLGLSWIGIFSERAMFHFGFAGHHLNRANISFYGGSSNKIVRRFTIHGGGEFLVTETFYISPSFLILNQGDYKEVTLGSSAGYRTKDSQNFIQAGVYRRFNNIIEGGLQNSAIGFGISAGCRGLIFGVAYDHSLAPDSFEGTLEASIGYIFGKYHQERTPFIRS